MRKPLLSRGPLLAGVCLLSLAMLPGIGENAQSAKRVPGIFDWSMRHVIYPRTGPIDKMIAAQRDPRATMIWQRQLGRRGLRGRGRGHASSASKGTKRDWSIYLGQNGEAAATFPAEFSFNADGTPSCPNDFVIFPINPINATGSATQPNIVALNYLYSGTSPTGICNTFNGRTSASTDDNTSAQVYWSYNVQGIKKGGGVSTSPALSYDQNGTGTGTKIAFVESGNGAAHFHVLAWKAGDGTNTANLQSLSGAIVTQALGAGGTGYAVGDVGTIDQGTDSTATFQVTQVGTQGRRTGVVTAYTITYNGTAYTTANGVATTDSTTPGATGFTINIRTVSAPVVTINAFSAATPVIGSGTATDLAFGGSTDTISSPFIDYDHDTAYVGNDAGQLYKIKDVFCMGTAGNPDCTDQSTGPAPSFDATWGAGGFVQVCGGRLSAPIYDYGTGNVFVGCSDGKLYSVSQTGDITSLQVGDGTTHGGIVDGPGVDFVNGFVYAVSGSESANGGATGVLVQAKTADLTSNVMIPVGTGGQCDLHEPVPNNEYLTSITSVGAGVYLGGVLGTVPQPCTFTSNRPGTVLELYAAGFTPSGTLIAAAPNGVSEGGGPGYEWAPFTELFNATAGTDWLFVGSLQNQTNVASFNITNPFAATLGATAREGMGVTGMVMDNSSAAAQASSFYFGAMGENAACSNITVTTETGGCAVKLTQGDLR